MDRFVYESLHAFGDIAGRSAETLLHIVGAEHDDQKIKRFMGHHTGMKKGEAV